MKLKSLPVIGAGVGAVLTLGIGGALASGAIGGQVQPTSDESVYVAPTETTAVTTTDAPAAVAEVPATTTTVPITPPAVEVSAATVAAVTTPAKTQAPQPQGSAPAPYDPMATFTDSAGNTYLPGPAAVPEPLPGEPGYVPAAG